MSALLYNGDKDISHERESRCINMLFVILVLYIIGIAFILLSVFGSKTEGLSTKHTLYTISAIITIAIFISIGYAIQYLTAALYGL
ncbi:TPA: hypothetical protein PQ887_001487 [Staphylococcus aureus]|nr:hypothetical protein [Staphylococcus aureus]HEA4267441.1 hypothetical protein [Staphylococcus aureus]